MNLVEINNLVVRYDTSEAKVHAVNGISLKIREKETIGLVGETGAGKTTTALAIMGLLPKPVGVIADGSILFDGIDLVQTKEQEMCNIRGNDISMIFQDPMTALNPVMRVGDQIAEVIEQHNKCSKAEAAERAEQMLKKVGIPAFRAKEYPHQFSGGMKQRVVIAIALACNPRLLLADEPTTALDVTIQAQVLDMMNELKKDLGTSVLMITHDLGVVAEVCDRVAIMYAGEIIEMGNLEDIFDHAVHPYTKGLFASLPSLKNKEKRLKPIAGLMPEPAALPEGCKFWPRCQHATEKCQTENPMVTEFSATHTCRCHLLQEMKGAGENG